MYEILKTPETNGTHTVSLSPQSQYYLESHVTKRKMRDAFGAEAEQINPYNSEKGYSSEWYFQKDGEIFGIGFRWNIARIRYKGIPETEKLEKFFNYIRKAIEKR